MTFIGTSSSTLGRVVEIFHPQGYLTRYAHLAAFADGLKKGDAVSAGQEIGTIGGSAFAGGQLVDGYWDPHLHFSVFHWNGGAWKVVDPFGWDPWAGPDEAARVRKQREDPLAACNGEVSFNLWVDGWPRAVNVSTAQVVHPTMDRYLGGWLGAEPGSADALGGQIAYTSGGEIHLLDLASSTDTQLTSSGDNHGPAWSYDGQYLLYIRGQAEGASVVVLDGQWGQVAEFPARAAAWANGAYQIYWIDTGHSKIYLSAMDGSGAQVYYAGLPDPSVENWEELSAGPKGGLNVSVTMYDRFQGHFLRLEADEYQNSVNTYVGPPIFDDVRPTGCLFSLAEARASGAWAYHIDTGCMMFAPGSVDIFCEKSPDNYIGNGSEPDWSPDENYLVYRFTGSLEGMPGWDFMGLEVRDLRTGELRQIVLDQDAREPAWRP